MLCIEGHRNTIGSFYARLSPLKYGKKKYIIFLLTLGLLVFFYLNFILWSSRFPNYLLMAFEKNNPGPYFDLDYISGQGYNLISV